MAPFTYLWSTGAARHFVTWPAEELTVTGAARLLQHGKHHHSQYQSAHQYQRQRGCQHFL
ncbi:MAG: hypothetical protein IPK76_17590 [Lewinellaceae bacterium]|nr:hypothetical protein [Lewinellaceae bacterium]